MNMRENTLKWFKTHFPDALPLIGEEALVNAFERNPRSPLMIVKVRTLYFADWSGPLGVILPCDRPNHTITRTVR